MSYSDAVVVFSALSQVPGRTRREMKFDLSLLREMGVTLDDIVDMSSSSALQWFRWNGSQFRAWELALAEARRWRAQAGGSGINVLTELDADAPVWFRDLSATPWLFYRGELSILDHVTIGFSGQRDAGEESLTIASALAVDAAQVGFAVVSGGARGIDMAAHASALNAGGTTVVILPQGIASWRPPHDLSRPTAASRVLAISEDVPWEAWNTESAMRRNRMIVDLSRIFAVPQSGLQGGSHSTGMYALKQGRVTYVPDLGPAFPGNQKLLNHGARLLQTPVNNRYDFEQMLTDSTPMHKPSQASLF